MKCRLFRVAIISSLAFLAGMVGWVAAVIFAVAGLGVSLRAYTLLRDLSNKSARKLSGINSR